MAEEVRTFLTQVVRDVMGIPLDNDLDDATLLGAGGLDLESLAFAELAVHTEREFGVQIPDEEFENIVQFTVGDFIKYVSTQLEASKAG